MFERYAHVLVPDDRVHPDSRSAILMVARELVRAHRTRGLGAHMVASGRAVRDACDDDVLAVMRGKLGGGILTRAVGVLEGRLLGRRPSLARTYRGLETLTGAEVVLVHNRLEGVRAAPRGAFRVAYLHNDALRRYSTRELRNLTPQVDLVVCVSQSLADRIPDALDAPRAVVLNGVDSAAFRPDARARSRDIPTVLYCGRIIPEKGVHLLIEAAIGLRSLPFRLRVVGAGSPGGRLSAYERGLRRLAETGRVADRITFDRNLPRSAIAQVLQAADLLSVPSVWADPCPLVVLEGLAAGLPVVGARTGGIPELGGDVCRYHLPGDVDDLRVHLQELILDPALRQTMGAAARRRAEHMSWSSSERTLVRSVEEQAAT